MRSLRLGSNNSNKAAISWPICFNTAVRVAVEKCEQIARDLKSRGSGIDSDSERDAVLMLDEMSDTICQVADKAELARNAHVSDSIRREAENASLSLSRFANKLNADTELYGVLVSAIETYKMDMKILTAIVRSLSKHNQ